MNIIGQITPHYSKINTINSHIEKKDIYKGSSNLLFKQPIYNRANYTINSPQ